MDITLHQSALSNQSSPIVITGSKSESNRLLLLQALFPNLNITNLSHSDDSEVMQRALQSDLKTIDVHHAGTAMRFLTAYYAVQIGKEITLTGSSRMQERPIEILVDALKDLGADMGYLGKKGYPPLRIKGKILSKSEVVLKADVSSQYISALLLIAPKLQNGLKLILEGNITSKPYINMTLSLLNQIGIETSFEGQVIQVQHQDEINNQTIVVESDWSSASYFYSLAALSPIGTTITLVSFNEQSIQGDTVLKEIYKDFGVNSIFKDGRLTLQKINEPLKTHFECHLVNAPDIAQTIAVTSFGLGLSCELTGLHTLKIKETDRLQALKTELEKLGGTVHISNDSLKLEVCNTITKAVSIDTYNDHRMAMAFAPLCLKTDIVINDFEVVSKSYPSFWDDLKTLGIKVSQ
ncbi:3-phosphoshikimate 1-carboxyvinyltransferase [Hanstruepera neustonica]|uniref:3-phosphoshikimate 1-carboxyvinyltransferase n=1 Tax=Hanstruepera neustonica TaxID=1445657 RepID=A0A2K1E0V6_9FLAO|nr:3-phosphoshikimate 1-carboxyvinyltransferase [Hanstruepera neustonica]PNQ73909.1 3-phosphoshikimate 1-carboxyvinyltransferase [Hanstruepera neustonica]